MKSENILNQQKRIGTNLILLNTNKMENFFYGTEFFSDMRELLYHLNMSDDKEVVEALPDDYAIKVEL